MDFEIGKTYEFDVLDITENSIGNKRLRLRSGDRDTYKCNLFPFQEDDMPNVVWCKVVKFDPSNGLPILVQDKAKFLQDNYTEGESYPFLITKISTDKNEKPYYELNDHWGFVHFGYFHGEPDYKENEEHLFEVFKIDTEKARLKLKIVCGKKTTNIPNGANLVNNGNESHTVEFKTSIVFTPGDSQPNIDEQLPKNVVREIAGFLNADGGTLYIGVNDNGVPVGMADDYAHLNDTTLTPADNPFYDTFVGSYKPSTDSYELKIRNAVERLLSQRALGNLQFEFPQKYAGNVCIIHIKPLKRPVFFNGNRLYVRTGNRVTQYKGDAIIDFIQDRFELQIHDVLDSEQLNLIGSSISIDDIESIVRKCNNAQPVVIPATTTPSITIPIPTVSAIAKTDDVWNFFTYYESGEYSIQKEEKHDADIVAQVCVHKSEKNQRILLCYDNGYVTSVVPSKIYDSNYRGKRRPKGWNTKAKLMNVFVANTFDMLGAISIDHTTKGHWVKVHNVSDLGEPKQGMNSQGNTFISSRLGTVSEYKFISASHRSIIPDLIFQKADTTTSLGMPETTQQYLNEVNYFQKINAAEDKQ